MSLSHLRSILLHIQLLLSRYLDSPLADKDPANFLDHPTVHFIAGSTSIKNAIDRALRIGAARLCADVASCAWCEPC